ncbi:phosphotransferase [Nocardioides sp.]|uniref:phosphotransferase n=1 Tax=Nocardioides sp. TaxID=35761 RepID=UPI0035AEF167
MKAAFASTDETGRRDALGADDVSDEALAAMVADLWGVPSARLVDSAAEEVAYDVPSILTGARTWVRGHADAGDGPRPFTFFVKRVHHWRHSPAFAFVPPEVAAWAADSVPWRAEVLLYASDLGERLPEGLTVPRALRVDDRPDQTAVLWLEAVEHDPTPWDESTYLRAAHLLGRLSASADVAGLAAIDPQPWHIRSFVVGRLGHTTLPVLGDEAVWQHPAVAEHFGPLRSRLAEVAGRLDALADEYAALPHLAAHGDACPNNLMRHVGDDGFTLIDFGFWRPQPVAYDLSQLLVGEIQMRRLDADGLPERAAACLEAYADGLAAEGGSVDADVLRRSHAVSLALFNGLPSIPAEALAEEDQEAAAHHVAQRAAMAAYSFDVLAATEG